MLGANTLPAFSLPADRACVDLYTCVACASAGPPRAEAAPGVNVEIQTVVGNYEVALVSSEDPEALVTWLIDNGYRITNAMRPYIERYTQKV